MRDQSKLPYIPGGGSGLGGSGGNGGGGGAVDINHNKNFSLDDRHKTV